MWNQSNEYDSDEDHGYDGPDYGCHQYDDYDYGFPHGDCPDDYSSPPEDPYPQSDASFNEDQHYVGPYGIQDDQSNEASFADHPTNAELMAAQGVCGVGGQFEQSAQFLEEDGPVSVSDHSEGVQFSAHGSNDYSAQAMSDPDIEQGNMGDSDVDLSDYDFAAIGLGEMGSSRLSDEISLSDLDEDYGTAAYAPDDSDSDSSFDVTLGVGGVYSRHRLQRDQILANLQEIPIKNEMNLRDKQCVICLEPLAIGQTMSILNCLHNYHHSCIRSWMQQNSKCPVCRTDQRTA